MSITQGSTVTWNYQSGGVEFSQTGQILSFVPPQDSANDSLKAMDIIATTRQRKFTDTSSNARYIIVVMQGGIPYFYAPTASTIEKQNPEVNKEELNEPPVNFIPCDVNDTPNINDITTKGNGTKYRVFAQDTTGGYVGYRLLNNSTIKFMIIGTNGTTFREAYNSSVRVGTSMFCKPMINGNDCFDITKLECISFVNGIISFFTAKNYTANGDFLLTELQNKACSDDTRRIVLPKFFGKG